MQVLSFIQPIEDLDPQHTSEVCYFERLVLYAVMLLFPLAMGGSKGGKGWRCPRAPRRGYPVCLHLTLVKVVTHLPCIGMVAPFHLPLPTALPLLLTSLDPPVPLAGTSLEALWSKILPTQHSSWEDSFKIQRYRGMQAMFIQVVDLPINRLTKISKSSLPN